MIKKILLSEQDLIDHPRSLPNRDPIYNKPDRFPCMLVDEIYRHVGNGNFGRTLDILYREDIFKLFNQLEDNNANRNAGQA